MLQQYLPVLVFATLGILVGGAFATLNLVLGPKRPKSLKQSAAARQADPYECGLPSEVSSSFRFGVSFYLVAMLFILFDIEVVFLIPWTFVYREFLAAGIPILAPIGFFFFVLVLGLVYEIKKGALEWEK
jgi:NADH-quinone oxidoreductase subunit A